MITTINKDNSKWRLIYNESVILLERVKKASFYVTDEKINFKMNLDFVFSEEGEKYKTKIDISEDGFTATTTLYKWDPESDFGHVENIQPLKLKTKAGFNIWVKFRTQASNKNDFRNFQVSVWTDEM